MIDMLHFPEKPKAIEVPILSDAIRDLNVPLSLAVQAGSYVFVSGIPPVDCVTGKLIDGSIAKQTKVAMEALKACLAAAHTTLDSVVSVKIYASNAGHYETINKVYAKYFKEYYPVRTFIPVGSWPGKFDIEIECIAYKK